MRRAYKIVSFGVAFLLLLPALSSAGQFKVTRVYDGDTLVAKGDDIVVRVRLVGIDAPETSKKKREPGQPNSQRAKSYLAGLILNKAVEAKKYALDRHRRILGVIYLDGKNIHKVRALAGKQWGY